jgi:type I restriction enzyme S subunit
LPFFFDVVAYGSVESEELKQHIDGKGKVLFERGVSEWREFRLEDFVDIHNQTRIPLSKMDRSRRQGIYPYYGASGIIDYVDDYLFDGEFVLVSEDGENLKSRKTPIAFKASGKFWVNNHAHIIQGKKHFHNNLIVYYFKNLDLHEFITGAVQPKLNKANLLSIPLYLPENESAMVFYRKLFFQNMIVALPPNPPQPLPQTTGEKAFLPFVQGFRYAQKYIYFSHSRYFNNGRK